MENRLLGIDPGRSKTGLALVDNKGQILELAIVATAAFAEELKAFLKGQEPSAIIMGDGTFSKELAAIIKSIWPHLDLHLVGEAHSTEEARALYWQVNPPRGWRSLLPLGLLVPTVPLDDYAAVVQVRRWLSNK